MATNRLIDAVPSANGHHKAKRGATQRSPRALPATSHGALKKWAYAGVGLTLTLSGALNGMAFASAAPHPVAGWALGLAIPVMVLVFSRVSALLWVQGRRWGAGFGAGATGAILLLSVQHLATAISALTGEALWCAALMALAVDVGLVVCEIATIRK